MSQVIRGLWSAVAKPHSPAEKPSDTVVVHDPAASRPHDLDDPFFGQGVQARVASVIAASTHKK